MRSLLAFISKSSLANRLRASSLISFSVLVDIFVSFSFSQREIVSSVVPRILANSTAVNPNAFRMNRISIALSCFGAITLDTAAVAIKSHISGNEYSCLPHFGHSANLTESMRTRGIPNLGTWYFGIKVSEISDPQFLQLIFFTVTPSDLHPKYGYNQAINV